MAGICSGALEATAKIGRVANAQLIDSHSDDDKAGDQLANGENVIDFQVQFGADQIDVRNNCCKIESELISNENEF